VHVTKAKTPLKLAVLLCLAAGIPARLDAQEASTPVFRSRVAMVPISAVVRDSRGRAVTTLKASDFEVRDNGEQRPILSFHTDNASPLTLAVLVDTSGSMRHETKLAAAKQVVAALSSELRPGIDSIGLFTFDSTLRELQTFTDRPAGIDTALAGADPFGVTSLYDAIAETARRLAAKPALRRAIVVLTDCVDTSSALAPAEVSGRASAIDVPVYIVATVPKIDQVDYTERSYAPGAQSQSDARHLAQWTGGDLLWATNDFDATVAGRHILSELRHQYVIAVDSSSDPNWRRLEVRVRDKKMVVRARSGYFGRDNGINAQQ
jgi:VWFA-related protein